MRGFIKFCSGAFVVLGMITMVLTGLAMVAVVKAGGSTNDSTGAALGLGVGLMVAAGGFFAGAATTLIGGATYLLASIDQRLEMAGKKPVVAKAAISAAPMVSTPDTA